MKIQLSNGQRVSVYFRYDEVLKLDLYVRRTFAFVDFFLPEDGVGRREIPFRIFKGAALCSVNDNFSRITGRKIALARALSSIAEEDLYLRKEIWVGLAESGMKMEHKKHEREIYILDQIIPPLLTLDMGEQK